MSSSKAPKGKQRRRAREFALQALFQWSVNPISADDLCSQFLENYEFSGVDIGFFMQLVSGAIESVDEADEYISSVVSRSLESVNALVKSILRLAVFELMRCPETPYRVVINEAIELQKSYGANEGRPFVNAVLDKLAPKLRPDEYKARVSKDK